MERKEFLELEQEISNTVSGLEDEIVGISQLCNSKWTEIKIWETLSNEKEQLNKLYLNQWEQYEEIYSMI